MNIIDWESFGPAIVVAVGALLALTADLLTTKRRWWLSWVPMYVGVIVAAAGLLRWDPAHEDFAFQFSAIILAGTFLVLLLSWVSAGDDSMPPGEFHFLLGSAVAGALVMVNSHDFVTLLVSLELLTLPSIALVGLRGGDRRAISTTWTFFLTSVTATALTLMGLALLYGLTGTLDFVMVRDAPLSREVPRGPLAVAVILTVIGLLFKLGAVPFHTWVPDAYRGASPVVTAFLATVSKVGALGGLVAFLFYAFSAGSFGQMGAFRPVWTPVIATFAALTITIGNVGALRQRDGIGVLAWSSVAHAGFLLAPLGAMLTTSQTALVQYLAIYLLANVVAFGALAVVARVRESTSYGDLAGLARTDPLVGLPLAFAVLTLAGFPPAVIGLVAKYVLLTAVVDGGPLWLAVVMAINVMIGLAYYLRLVAVLFASRHTDALRSLSSAPGVKVATLVVLVTGVALAALSIWPSLLLTHVQAHIAVLL